MTADDAVAAMDALGHPIRLRCYRTLVRTGRKGLTIADLQTRLDGVPRSTLAHHLGKLVDAGLVAQRRERATVVCTVDFARMDSLVDYLTHECCVEELAG